MRGAEPVRRLGSWCLRVLWGLGGGAAVFLLLCAAGVVAPETLVPAGPEEAVPAAMWTRPAPVPVRAAALSPEDLDRAGQAASGADSVVMTMKEPGGALAWVSALPQAADCGASWGDPARNEALRAMNRREGLYTVAKVFCLRDGALVRACPGLALERASGSPWRDEAGDWWLDPADQGTQTYLIGLCRELADLGFDEVLLADCRYPSGYEGAEDRVAALETFCRRVRGGLADLPVQVSIQAAEEDGRLDPDSGQTPALLASFNRVWVRPGEEGLLPALHPAVLPEP